MSDTEDSGSDRSGAVVPGFKVRGMEPQRNIYDFLISIDAEFADELRSLDASKNQEGAAEHIGGALTHDMSDVRFVGDSFLLRGITVGFQATGLDLYKDELGRQQYATHNVDTPGEAIEIIAAFSRWEDLASHLLEDRRENDGLRADGGTTVRKRKSVPSVLVDCEDCGEPFEITARDFDLAHVVDPDPGFRCNDCQLSTDSDQEGVER